MIPCPWVAEIATYVRSHPTADFGLHLTLTSEWTTLRWGPVLPTDRVPSLLAPDGYFYKTEADAVAHIDPREVEAEVRSQIERARAFGIMPTHLDSHMGTLYQSRSLFEVLLRVARDNRLPVRMWKGQVAYLAELLKPGDVVLDRRITIDQSIAPDHWVAFYTNAIRSLQPGVTEINIHLAYDDDEMR